MIGLIITLITDNMQRDPQDSIGLRRIYGLRSVLDSKDAPVTPIILSGRGKDQSR
jgi:hypothetical protein